VGVSRSLVVYISGVMPAQAVYLETKGKDDISFLLDRSWVAEDLSMII